MLKEASLPTLSVHSYQDFQHSLHKSVMPGAMTPSTMAAKTSSAFFGRRLRTVLQMSHDQPSPDRTISASLACCRAVSFGMTPCAS